jgi:hypothetical protein
VGATAGIVAESLHAFGSTLTSFRGQSFTTGPALEYSNLSFNFYQWDVGLPAYAPATQTYFLLNKEFLGRNDQLSAATPGFMATTTGVSGDQWVFDPSVTLLGNTQYWLYGNGSYDVSTLGTFAVGSTYSGGQLYASGGGPENAFSAESGYDLAFTINSGLVPEPASLELCIFSLTGDTLTLTFKNIPSGQTFHLRQSTDLINFAPFSPPLDITDTTSQPLEIQVDLATSPTLFIRAYEGASPTLLLK